MDNKVNINGTTVSGGRSIVIKNDRVIVDGIDVTPGDEKSITIEIHGDVTELSADACNTITISGAAGTVKTMSGTVQCGDVSGSVQTMSGSVSCGNVAGPVSTMSGDIHTR